MTRPAVSSLAEALYDDTAFAHPHDEALGWPWLIFTAGFGAGLGQLPDLVRDTDQGLGWSPLVDPDRAPVWALPWLAQVLGVTLQPGLTDQARRNTIRDLPPQRRATATAVIDAARRTLTGVNPRADLTVQATGIYEDRLTTYAVQTPDSDATFRAADAQMPAWRKLTLVVVAGWAISEMETAYTGQTIADLEGDFATVNDLETHLA